MSYLFFHRYGTGIDFGIEVYILLLKAFSKIDRRLLLKGILLNQYYSSLFRLHNLHRQRDSLQITIWLVWGAEHADEGSRRVKTLLPSSVTDNGFAALDIIEFTMEQEIVELAVNIINQIVIIVINKHHAEINFKKLIHSPTFSMVV